jgi:electron transport complex protein RnfG
VSAGPGALVAGPRREPGSLRLAGTLFLAGLLSGLAIVLVYRATLPVITANQARELRAAVFRVVPGSVTLAPLAWGGEELVAAADAGQTGGSAPAPQVFAALDGSGALRGYAIPAEGPGFQDTISLLFGYDASGGRIIGMTVLESRETPGLGDKIYKDDAFVACFDSLAVDPAPVVVKNGEKSAPNEVDGITGATISSKAVVRIVNGGLETWRGRLPADLPEAARARAAETPAPPPGEPRPSTPPNPGGGS